MHGACARSLLEIMRATGLRISQVKGIRVEHLQKLAAGASQEEADREMAEKKLLVDERRRLADEALLMRESLSGSETSSPNFSRLQSLNDDGDSTAVPNRA